MASWDGKNKSAKRPSSKAPVHPVKSKIEAATPVRATVPVIVPPRRRPVDRISSLQSARDTAITERRARVAELYCTQRMRKAQIAATLSLPRPDGVGANVTVEMVTNDLVHIRATWRDRAAEHLDELKAEELADLEWMEAQAAQAAVDPLQADDASQWFGKRLAVKERKAKLLGLDAATRQEISGPNGGPITLSVELLDLILVAANVNWDPRDERGRPVPVQAGQVEGAGADA